ncbi:MAG: UpxY family transcription antiterminator [Bacteroidota bacterium]
MSIIGKKWFVVYTLSRNEKKVKEYFDKIKIENFLPLIKIIKFYSDRKKKVEVPLFPSYIFINITWSRHLEALNTPGVVGFVRFNSEPAIISESDLLFIKNLINEEVDLTVENRIYKKGQNVKINYKNLTDYVGTVIEYRGSKRLVIGIAALNKTIVLPASYLEFII